LIVGDSGQNVVRDWLTRFTKEFAKAIVAMVLVVSAMLLYGWFEERPAEQFCSEMTPSATPESVVALARSRGLPAHEYANEHPHLIVVDNHESPFFRFACRITFAAGGAKAVAGADD
jgi:hypothetical protein